MTDLHTIAKTYCDEYNLKYPSLIALQGDYAIDRNEFIQMVYSTASNP